MATPVNELSDSDLAILFGLNQANEVELDQDGQLVRTRSTRVQSPAPAAPVRTANLSRLSDVLRGPRWD